MCGEPSFDMRGKHENWLNGISEGKKACFWIHVMLWVLGLIIQNLFWGVWSQEEFFWGVNKKSLILSGISDQEHLHPNEKQAVTIMEALIWN